MGYLGRVQGMVMASPAVVRRALVTGASSGIGRACAQELVRRGFTVYGAARSGDRLQDAARAVGTGFVPLVMDVRDPASVAAGFDRMNQESDGLCVDVLVNAAGYGQPGPLELVGDDLLRAQFETNVFGLLRVTRAAIPAMRARGAGRIIHIGSVAGRLSVPNLGAYTATKHALEALSDTMRMELHPWNIRVTLIRAGLVRTGFEDRAAEAMDPLKQASSPYARFLATTDRVRLASRRLACESEDVARVVGRVATCKRPPAACAVPVAAQVALALEGRMGPSLQDALLCRLVGYPRSAGGGLQT